MATRTKDAPFARADHEEILELVGIAVMTIDGAGTLIEANVATTEMFGYPIEDLVGKNVKVLMPQHYAVKHDGYLQHHLATGETHIIGSGRKVQGLRQDGTVFPMHLAVGRFERDGQPFFTGIVHDLSKQERVQDNMTRFGRIIDESLNEIYVFDSNTLRFSMVNRGALENLGYSLEEMLEMTPVDIKPKITEEEFDRLVMPLRTGELDRLEFQTVHQRKDGTFYDVDILIHLSDAVLPSEFVSIVQDSTERNQITNALHQAQKMESLGQLTGGIAHDFNNMLTVVSGNLELLENRIDDPLNLELLSEARAAVNMGADLTSRLLSFARKSSLIPTTVNINQAVLSLVELLRRSLGEQIILHTIMEPELWCVQIDESLLGSALMNLAINAHDAMPKGGEFTIETRNLELTAVEARRHDIAAGEYVALIITDTGTGIPKEFITSVFEPFFTTRQHSSGTGLGLSMVYGFARQSGGHVTVTSEIDKGSVFTLLLPRSEERAPGLVCDRSRESEDSSRSLRVLVVEDDELVRRLTTRRLRYLGHDVLQAANSGEALQVFNEHPDVELLITDMIMPESLSGHELALLLREQAPELQVIIASGYSDELAALENLTEERMVLLRKPYDNYQLREALDESDKSWSS